MIKNKEVLTDRAKSILAEAEIRATSIRVLVLREILQTEYAFTLADMEEKILTLDKSTLCRTLNLFLSRRILHEVDNDNGHKMYCRCICSIKQEVSHIHFTCLSCHKIFCVRSLIKEDINSLQVPHPENFEVTEVNYVLKGLCPKCKNKSK